MKRNLFAVMSLLVVATMLIAGCGGAATQAPAPTQAAPAAAPTTAPVAAPTKAPAPTTAPTAAAAAPTTAPTAAAAAPTTAPTAAAATTGALPAAAKYSGPAVSLVMWTKEGGNQLDHVKADVKAFTDANTNVKIDVVNYDVEKLRENFQTSMLAGQGPDLLWTVNDHAGPFTTAGLISPVDDMGFDLKSLATSALQAVQLQGKYWGIPLSNGNHLMLLYNTAFIKTAPADTDAMIKAAKDFQGTDTTKFGLAWNQTEPFWLVPWLGAFGGKVFDDSGKPTLNTDAMVKAFQIEHDLKFVSKITPNECDYNCMDGLFKSGKAAMIINGDWSLGDYTKVMSGTWGLGVAPIPMVTGAGWPAPYTAGTYIMFPNSLKGDKLNAAKALTNYFLSDTVQMGWVKTDSRLPSVQKLYSDPTFQSNPILAGSIAALQKGTGTPAQTEMRCNWDALKPNLQAVMSDKMTAKDAAAASQTASEQCVAQLK